MGRGLERSAHSLFTDHQSLFAAMLTRQPEATLLAMKVAALQVWFGQDADDTVTSQRMLEWAKKSTLPAVSPSRRAGTPRSCGD